MIRSDNHIHTYYSADSKEPMENVLQEAIKKGFTSLCFTDHMDYGFPTDKYGLDFTFSMENYLKEIKTLSKKYPALTLRSGVEIGLKKDVFSLCHKLAETYPLDFIIGSTHLVDDIDPYYDAYWETYGETAGILHYYETTLENIQMGFDFDVYGHIDYVIRYTPSMKKYRTEGNINDSYINTLLKQSMEIIQEILIQIVQRGYGIEVNTAGFKYGLGHPNPHEQILTLYKEAGGEILSIGSDAHEKAHLGYDFSKLPALLSQCGFAYYTEFADRKPIMLPID